MRTLISVLSIFFTFTSFASDTSFDHTAAAQLMAETNYAGTVIKSEQALAENPNKLGLFEPLTKSYAYLGMFDTAAQRTQELYFESDAEHPLLTLRGYCRYALFHTMQGDREQALAAVDEMLTHETPENIYPGAPACSTFFDTAWNNNDCAEYNLQRVIEAAPNWTL